VSMNKNKLTASPGDVEEKKRSESEEKLGLEQIITIGKKFRQLGLYMFIWYWFQIYKDGVDFSGLWGFYNNIADHVVNPETVRKQLKMLQAKGLVEERGGKFYPVPLPPDVAVKLFDVERSRVGKRGAATRLRQILYRNQLPFVEEIPRGLKRYVRKIVDTAVQLALQGKREVALDLLVHTLLPVRKTGILWIWRNDEFIYFEKKTMVEGTFHSVKFFVLARLLRELGFHEGVMVWHIYGHEEAKQLIHKIFGKGHLSWPWARSIFYKLKQLGLASEGSQYIIEIEYRNMALLITLCDIYNNLLKEYFEPWFNETKLPPPLSAEKKTKDRYLVIGRQHVKEEIEESYFARW